MSTAAAAADKSERNPNDPRRWSRGARVWTSALLLLHLCALLAGPFSLPPTMLSERIHKYFRPYLGATYLDHAYKFFAPEPGPSHLIRYELEFADGSHRGGVFPNLQEEQPRLFYHRHFMLTESLNSLSPPPGPEWNPRSDWRQTPLSDEQRQLARSYANHMLHKHKARRVTLWLREHDIPVPDQVVKGMKLDDPSLYRERTLGSFVEMQ